MHRLPALYRFWELALHVRGNNGNGQDMDLSEVVAQVWGRVEEAESEDEET